MGVRNCRLHFGRSGTLGCASRYTVCNRTGSNPLKITVYPSIMSMGYCGVEWNVMSFLSHV
jgi:hypothetical protein